MVRTRVHSRLAQCHPASKVGHVLVYQCNEVRLSRGWTRAGTMVDDLNLESGEVELFSSSPVCVSNADWDSLFYSSYLPT